jgi:23S rRNA pseudouridine2605 synthase
MSLPRKPRRNASIRGEFMDRSRGVRLQRILADAGTAARRECEELILAGAVTVNGKIVDTLPAFADPANDRIEVYGRPLRPPEKHVYVVLFKPRGTVCTNSDPEGRPRAIDLVRHPSRARLYCVGRLDLDSSGLILLTNDGAFANRLTHPRFLVEKGYDLTLEGSLDERGVAALERELFGARAKTDGESMRSSLRFVSRDRDKTVVHMTLCEHRNVEIRPLMVEFGHPVKKLRRTRFGPLRLKGLAVGEWRDLTSKEVEQLMRSSRTEDPTAARKPKAPRRSMEELAQARVERAAREGQEAERASAQAPQPPAAQSGARRPARDVGPKRSDTRVPPPNAPRPAKPSAGERRPDRGGAARGSAPRGAAPRGAAPRGAAPSARSAGPRREDPRRDDARRDGSAPRGRGPTGGAPTRSRQPREGGRQPREGSRQPREGGRGGQPGRGPRRTRGGN